MKIEAYSFHSATGECVIHGDKYTPDNGDVKAVLAIHHGMAEHHLRYLDFIEYLTGYGYAVYMYDMANHGKSNQDFSKTGYFGKEQGYKALVQDYAQNIAIIKKDYPDKKLVIMGHSMGSFIVRCFTARNSNAGFDAAIYMGTGGSNPMAPMGKTISALFAKLNPVHKSALLDKMTFGSYNAKFEKRTGFDWLTRDAKIVDKYISDEMCGFLFSVQGMNDLVNLNIEANLPEWYSAVPKELPVLLVSGDMDPVGNYSKGIREINDKLIQSGHTNVTMKLYKDGRHEILNELNRDEVYSDIRVWIESVLA